MMATNMVVDRLRLTLRPVNPDDEQFLYLVFASTREEEMALTGWTAVQQEAFLRRQFRAQADHYHNEFPGAQHSVILNDGRPIGRLFVHRSSEAIDLVDISILPGSRDRGIGTFLIEQLLGESRQSGKPLRLFVFKLNRAARLYDRLGFRRIGETPTHFQMEAKTDF